MALLELRGIRKRFGATQALSGVDLEVAPGEVHALVGENGAGKSTLMNVLSGAFPPDAGTMRFNGVPYSPADARAARRAGIVHLHQELSLCPHLTVAENIFLGLEPARFGWVERERALARTAELLKRFGCEHIAPGARLASLSLPDRQVVEICRALAADARLVLMDEPTSSLSKQNVARLFDVIRELRGQGIAIIYISHFLEEVREIADRFTVLRDGASVSTGELASVTDQQLIFDMVGRSVEAVFEGTRGTATDDVLLDVRDLSAPPGLRSASFALRRGEVLGIAGLIGSGRTEMVKALFGLAKNVRGNVLLRGRSIDIGRAAPHERISAGVGYLSEDRKHEGLALPMSLSDNITLTRFERCSRAGWIARTRQREQAAECMVALNVRAAGPEARVASLSGGNQQKVAMARLLYQDPDVLLLDEPTRGIDVGSKADLYAQIARLAASGKAILMVSSYLPELFGVCDRIAVMRRGRLGPARNVSEWTPETVMEAAIAVAEDASVPA